MPQQRTKSFALAVAYYRVSTEDQNLGVDVQRNACMAWSTTNKIEIIGEFEDRCSGKTPWRDRPAFRQAMDVAKGLPGVAGVDFVVAHKRDRFARDVRIMGDIESELLKLSCRPVVAIEDPFEDPTPESELRNVIIDGFGQYERRLISARTRAALMQLKAKGVKLGSPGYHETERGREILAALAEIRSQKICSWALIAAELNARGIKTLRGHEWNKGSVRSLIEKLRKEKDAGHV